MRAVFACALALTACSREAVPSPSRSTAEPIASTPVTMPPVASASTEPAVTYVPTTLELGVRVDVPSFMNHRAGADVDTQFTGGQAEMTLITEGECGHTMKGFCRPLTAAEKSFTRTMTDSTCLETGLVGDRIVWRRRRIADEVEYEITLRYPASEKARFDPIVEHVAKSWTVPAKATAGYRCDVR